MKKEELDRLVAKYYEGESSEEDEELLKTYFSNTDTVDEYKAEELIFEYYSHESKIEEPSADFEKRIISGIDEKKLNKGAGIFRRLLIPSISAAAGIFVIIASYFFIINRNRTFDTYSDPALAYAETVKILMEVSQKINRGTAALGPLVKINEVTDRGLKAINESTSVLEENLKKIDYFKKGIINSDYPDKNDK